MSGRYPLPDWALETLCDDFPRRAPPPKKEPPSFVPQFNYDKIRQLQTREAAAEAAGAAAVTTASSKKAKKKKSLASTENSSKSEQTSSSGSIERSVEIAKPATTERKPEPDKPSKAATAPKDQPTKASSRTISVQTDPMPELLELANLRNVLQKSRVFVEQHMREMRVRLPLNTCPFKDMALMASDGLLDLGLRTEESTQSDQTCKHSSKDFEPEPNQFSAQDLIILSKYQEFYTRLGSTLDEHPERVPSPIEYPAEYEERKIVAEKVPRSKQESSGPQTSAPMLQEKDVSLAQPEITDDPESSDESASMVELDMALRVFANTLQRRTQQAIKAGADFSIVLRFAHLEQEVLITEFIPKWPHIEHKKVLQHLIAPFKLHYNAVSHLRRKGIETDSGPGVRLIMRPF